MTGKDVAAKCVNQVVATGQAHAASGFLNFTFAYFIIFTPKHRQMFGGLFFYHLCTLEG
jgi:hypothetical protein